MKKAKILLLLVCLVAGYGALANPQASAQNAQDFTIESFEADYHLGRDNQKVSTLQTKETIKAVFPTYDQNHGILRAIPKSYASHTLSLVINSVTDQRGSPLQVSTYEQNDNLVLRIGDPDVYVHGTQIYVISYHMRNVAGIFPDHEELYWNVNGSQWPQPFAAVQAQIHIPKDLTSSLQPRQKCYAGAQGSTDETSCAITSSPENEGTLINVSTTKPLGPNSTLSFVLGFNKGTFIVGPEIAHEKLVHKLKIAGLAASVALPPIAAFLYMFRKWRQMGNDPKGRGIIIPEYEPPKGLDALQSDYLMKESLRNIAFSAMLVEQATKGNVTIYEIPKKGLFGQTDYELELTKVPDGTPKVTRLALQIVFNNALTPGFRRKISSLKPSKNSSGIYPSIKSLENDISSNMFKDGYFSNEPLKVKSSYTSLGVLLLIVATILVYVGASHLRVVLIPVVGIVLAAFVVAFFVRVMPARSVAGVEAYDKLLGLKDYIKLAEADRLKFLQSPEGAEKIQVGSFDPGSPVNKVKLFETLLPYAMLFGLEKEWAKQFNDIYSQPPDWYRGNLTAFNAGYLASSLGDFSTASGTTFSPPSSSGGSGFGGGGFSGGGGGGGGGGGW